MAVQQAKAALDARDIVSDIFKDSVRSVGVENNDDSVIIRVHMRRVYASAWTMLRVVASGVVRALTGADVVLLPRQISYDYAEAWALWHGRKLALLRAECEDGECVLSIMFSERETFALEQALHELATSAEYYGWGRG